MSIEKRGFKSSPLKAQYSLLSYKKHVMAGDGENGFYISKEQGDDNCGTLFKS